ncbi:TPA_asm: nucleocapsid protein [Centaurea virus 1]|uniref:Nucleoprotein n=1 Tax=Centaurea virus 1 TaxID=2977962 RepID=A0A9N6YJC5_9RHAB|nr:TPA_asm: nucleocapsid protein [Centaurea virus 1]
MSRPNAFELQLRRIEKADRLAAERNKRKRTRETYEDPPDDDLEMEIIPRRGKVQHHIMAAALAEPLLPMTRCTLPFGNVGSHIENLLTWNDNQLGPLEIYNLYYLNSPDALNELGDEVFSSLKGNLTNASVCKILLLAYNLRNNNGDHIFSDLNYELIDGEPRNYAEMTVRNLASPNSSGSLVTKETATLEEENIAYCYLAASYLRLFTKSAENYSRIGDHIKNGFSGFFSFEFPFTNHHPDIEVIRAVKNQFDTDYRLKNTFYVLLYAGEACRAGRDLKQFLYVMHTTYTGMHCYGLFLRNLDLMRVEPADLATCFDCDAFKREITSLSSIMTNLHNTSSQRGKECQMWRFARIFDKNFAAHLQTKNSTQFTAIMATLYHRMIPPTDRQDARKIAKVKEYLEADDGFCDFYAKKTMVLVMKKQYPDNFKVWYILRHHTKEQIARRRIAMLEGRRNEDEEEEEGEDYRD